MNYALKDLIMRIDAFLCAPRSFIRDPVERLQSRLLSVVLLTTIIFGGLMVVADVSSVFSRVRSLELDDWVSMLSLLVLVLAYLVNRSGRSGIAAHGTILFILVAIFLVSIPESPEHADDIGMLYFLPIPLLFSGMLLSFRSSVVVGALVMVGLVTMDLFHPWLDRDAVPVYSLLIIVIAMLTAQKYRDTIEERRNKALTRSEQRFRTMVTHAPQGVVLYDPADSVILEINSTAQALFGITSEQVLRKKWHSLVDAGSTGVRDNDRSERISMFVRSLRECTIQAMEGQNPVMEVEFTTVGGSSKTCEVRMTGLPGASGTYVFAGFIDVTARKEAEAQLRYLATHDVVTELPNRTLLFDRLRAAITRARRSSGKVAILFLDLDDFKAVNDGFDHHFGDQLLKAVGGRLRETVRASDTVARFGGDEFVLVLEYEGVSTRIVTVLRKILDHLTAPIRIERAEILVTASIGVSVFPRDGESPEVLMKKADTAVYRAKREGKNIFQFYENEMSRQAGVRMEFAAELRRAIEQDMLHLEYQPQVRIADGSVVGMEALARWKHPVRGLVSPGVFIPVAEETGMIADLGDWALLKACRVACTLQSTDRPVRISVNVSGIQLRENRIVASTSRVLEETGLAPDLLELELTENILFGDLGETVRLLNMLKELGVRLAVDDFGSGFSTLRQLARFPIDTLKLDKCFADGIVESPQDNAVVEGVISIARNLGMETVGEGIENADQVEKYRRYGCDLIQGFFYSPPVSEEMFMSLIHKNIEKK
jgi:diguanylate cyclase (GGDEF)-like protein/PAS domain S-box-containing protein